MGCCAPTLRPGVPPGLPVVSTAFSSVAKTTVGVGAPKDIQFEGRLRGKLLIIAPKTRRAVAARSTMPSSDRCLMIAFGSTMLSEDGYSVRVAMATKAVVAVQQGASPPRCSLASRRSDHSGRAKLGRRPSSGFGRWGRSRCWYRCCLSGCPFPIDSTACGPRLWCGSSAAPMESESFMPKATRPPSPPPARLLGTGADE